MPMPITSMNENGQLPTRKNEIGLAREVSSVKSESKT
jgi:hypothetical protein